MESLRGRSPGEQGHPHTMASVVVKTIWQSKEIHEAGDPPAGVESRAQLVPEAPGGVTTPAKGITKKKKAVSFHGWVCRTLSGTVLAPSTASNRARVPPWVLEEGEGEKRRGQRRGRQEGGGRGDIVWEVERKTVVGMEGGRERSVGKRRLRKRSEDKGREKKVGSGGGEDRRN